MNDNQTIDNTPETDTSVTQDGVANDVTTQPTTTTNANNNDTASDNSENDDFGKLYDKQLKSKIGDDSKDDANADDDDNDNDSATDENTGTKNPIPKKTSKSNVSDENGVQDDKDETSIDIKERNRTNAERRIRNKQRRAAKHNEAVQARIASMQKELDYYSDYAQKHPEQDAQVKAASQMIQGRMDDMQALQQDQALDEFTDRANETFGEDTEANAQFTEQTERYAQYINENEPALGKMVQRPYGLIVLKEWMDAMEEPENRSTWENYTEFEKQEALSKLNKSIVSSFKKPANKKPTATKTSTNVPVPASGRAANASNDETPIDDFAQAYQSLVNKKRKHRVDNPW